MPISSRRCAKSSIHSQRRAFKRSRELNFENRVGASCPRTYFVSQEGIMNLEEAIRTVKPLDEAAMQAARVRQDTLTKPRGSLGKLEELSMQLAGMKADPFPSVERKAVIVMAADHGVTVEGVSAYPAEVTRQMVLNFLRGGAAINVLARQAGARVAIVDIGVASDIESTPGLIQRKVRCGTRNLAQGPAMTREEAEQALQVGVDVLHEEAAHGLDIIATGEMGIGNTTSSSAIVAAMTGLPASQVVGRGTGIDDQGLEHKIKVIEQALAINQPNKEDPMDILHKVGGLEIAGLAGVMFFFDSPAVPVVFNVFLHDALPI